MAKKAIILLNEGGLTAGKVENLIEMTDSAAVGFVLPQGRLLWDCESYPVMIGDDWHDGVFRRNGEEIYAVPTVENRLSEAEAAINALLTGKEELA